jgi:hypothetical protein
LKKLLLGCVAAGVLALGLAATAAASGLFTTFGNATVNPDGSVTLVSDTSKTPAYGGIDLSVPSGLTVNGLTQLSTDYNVTNTDCKGGSPRFQLNVDGKNVFVYIGPVPSFTGCATGWQTTGNLITSGEARFDLTQYGGPFYGTWADAKSMLGTHAITGIQLVADAGWAFPNGVQTIIVRNVQVNGTTYELSVGPPTSKDQCKKGGWRQFDNPPFKNQGQCVAYVEHHSEHGRSGHHRHH